MTKLLNILKRGYWIQVTPLSRVENGEWILAIYKKGKKSWTTDICESGFSNPKEAYKWGFAKIKSIE